MRGVFSGEGEGIVLIKKEKTKADEMPFVQIISFIFWGKRIENLKAH